MDEEVPVVYSDDATGRSDVDLEFGEITTTDEPTDPVTDVPTTTDTTPVVSGTSATPTTGALLAAVRSERLIMERCLPR